MLLASQHLPPHLFHLFAVLQYQRLRYDNPALSCRTRVHSGNPALQIAPAINLDPAPTVDADPAPVSYISDAIFVAQKFATLELRFQDFEQPPAFVVVALDGRRKFFRKIAVEH